MSDKDVISSDEDQRLTLIGRVAESVTLELNNLLTVIRLNAAIVARDDVSGPDIETASARIDEACERASVLNRKLLGVARGTTGVSERIAIDRVVVGLESTFETLRGQGVQIETRVREGGLWVVGNRSDVERLVVDLVFHAADSAEGRGSVKVECGRVPEGIEVTVRGKGMTEDGLREVQEMANAVTRSHGGRLEISDDPGGRTFRVIWSAAPTREPVVDRGGSTILLVEDDVGIREITRHILDQFGFKVIEAGSGEEAVEIWRESRHRVSLLLLDIELPGGVSGIELAGHINAERGSDLPVIFMSGYYGLDESMPVLTEENFLPKPFHPSELLTAVRAALEGAHRA